VTVTLETAGEIEPLSVIEDPKVTDEERTEQLMEVELGGAASTNCTCELAAAHEEDAVTINRRMVVNKISNIQLFWRFMFSRFLIIT